MANNEKDKIRPYEVDGIQEYDNPLPRWWVWFFVSCIVFAVAYMLNLYLFNGTTLLNEYEKDMAELKTQEKKVEPSANSGGAAQGQSLEDRLKNPETITKGKEIFVQNCSPCHGENAQGVVGPNLTDKFWIHGGAPDQIIHTIEEGVPPKGMIAWKPILGTAKIEQVAAYILSLKDSNPAGAKGPEGEPYPK